MKLKNGYHAGTDKAFQKQALYFKLQFVCFFLSMGVHILTSSDNEFFAVYKVSNVHCQFPGRGLVEKYCKISVE